MKTSTSAHVPEEIFHAIAALVNRLIFLSKNECQLEPIELLTLWHIRHVGAPYAGGQTAVLRQELTRMLKEKFRFNDPGVSRLLRDLQNAGVIVRTAVSDDERRQMFGSFGDTRVVILNSKGKQKIEDFKGIIRSRVEPWLAEQRPAIRLTIRAVHPVIVRFAHWLVKRYEPERMKLLYPPKHSR
jgi:DNA-binding MarR family transcriptional regulator